jgi:hypothetical protein
LDFVQLLVAHGYDPKQIDMKDVFNTWDPAMMEFFIDKGADVETGNPWPGLFAIGFAPPFGSSSVTRSGSPLSRNRRTLPSKAVAAPRDFGGVALGRNNAKAWRNRWISRLSVPVNQTERERW